VLFHIRETRGPRPMSVSENDRITRAHEPVADIPASQGYLPYLPYLPYHTLWLVDDHQHSQARW
jgi:hypothetical protein